MDEKIEALLAKTYKRQLDKRNVLLAECYGVINALKNTVPEHLQPIGLLREIEVEMGEQWIKQEPAGHE